MSGGAMEWAARVRTTPRRGGVLALLARYSVAVGGHWVCWASDGAVGAAAGCSSQAAHNAICGLEREGHIARERRRIGGRERRCIVLMPSRDEVAR